jgi:hypothetical protein
MKPVFLALLESRVTQPGEPFANRVAPARCGALIEDEVIMITSS